MTTRAISLSPSCFIYRLSEPKPIEKWSTFIKKIFLGIFGRNLGYFGVFCRFFFGYIGIPLPPLADLAMSFKLLLLQLDLDVELPLTSYDLYSQILSVYECSIEVFLFF